MKVSTISAIMACVLIVAGIGQIFYQMTIISSQEVAMSMPPSFAAPEPQLADFVKWSFRTSYPGVIMIVAGVVLLGLGNLRRSN